MAYVTNTLENQSIVLKTWGRGAKLRNPKIFFPLHGVKIEELGGGVWSFLTFIDPFTQKEVKIKKMRTNYHAINAEDKSPFHRYGIPGFAGFTDPVKRERKKKNTTKQRIGDLTPQGMLGIKHGGALHTGRLLAGPQPPVGINAATGKAVGRNGEFIGEYHEFQANSFGKQAKMLAALNIINEQIQLDVQPFVGASITSQTIAEVKQTIADSLIKVTQNPVYRDRLDVEMTLMAHAPKSFVDVEIKV